MAKYRSKKRRSRNAVPTARSASYGASSRVRRSADEIAGLRSSRQRRGFGVFLRRNIRFVAIGGFVLVLGVIALFLFVIGKDTVPAAGMTDAEQTADTQAAKADIASAAETPPESVDEIGEFDEESEYAYENVDEATLEGLTGSDDSLFSDVDEEMADALLAEEGLRIGVTIGDLSTDNDKLLLGKLEAVASMAETAKEVYEVYFYNAGGDYNQQIQDVRSLIKNKVDVIIVGATEKSSFDMVTAMAGAESIPVVAYNAPDTTGYTINVVADQTAWGKVYGDFMAQNLTEGEVVKVLGSEESEIDSQRETAMDSALAANEMITMADTAYAQWDGDKAGQVMTETIDAKRSIDGVITEEGMAQAILEAFVQARTLPKVMCGDATAGYIKLWYTLRSQGVDITPEPDEDDEEILEEDKIYFKASDEELTACAQPAPVTIGAVAFDVAMKLAEGRTLISDGSTFTYAVETLITNENLMDYYVMVKDQPDSYVVRDIASDVTIEALFEPMMEEEETPES